MDDQRIDRTGGWGLKPLTPKERRFARQLLAAGAFIFVLSWFRVVTPMVGRIALLIGVFGGRIARGFDSAPINPPEQK